MSNVYFDWVVSAARFARGTKVRAEAVNDALDSVTAGFDKLPTEAQLNQGTRNYIASDTGSADAYAGSLTHVTGAYADGQEIDILIANTNLTTTPTLDVSGIGATLIKTPGANVVAIGVLLANSIARLKYNDTLSHWELTGVYDITNTVSAFMATMLDDADADAVFATLGTTSGNTTPVLSPSAGSGLTLSTANLDYYTMGDLVFVNIEIVVSSLGTASGTLTISPLPFTTDASIGLQGLNMFHYLSATLGASDLGITATVSGTTVTLRTYDSTGSSNGLQVSDITASTRLYLQGVYKKA